MKKKTEKVKCFWCGRPATIKDWREIDGVTGSYPSCDECTSIATEDLLKPRRDKVKRIAPNRIVQAALGVPDNYICLNCGKRLIPVIDEIAGKFTGHLWTCTCFPEGVRLSIG